MTIQVVDAILSLVPGAQVSVVGNSVDSITWHETPESIPTSTEILNEVDRLNDLQDQLVQDAISAKESALLKLAALGITEEDFKALIGGL